MEGGQQFSPAQAAAIQPPLTVASTGTTVYCPRECVASARFTSPPLLLSNAPEQRVKSTHAPLEQAPSPEGAVGTSEPVQVLELTQEHQPQYAGVHCSFFRLLFLPSDPCPSPKRPRTAQVQVRWPAFGDVYIVFKIQHSGM